MVFKISDKIYSMKIERQNVLDELADECPSDTEWLSLVNKSIADAKALHEYSNNKTEKFPEQLVDCKLDIPFEIQIIIGSRYSPESRLSFYNYEIYGTSGVKCKDLINDGPKSQRDLKALKRLIFGPRPISVVEQFEEDRKFKGYLEVPNWIMERYINQYGHKPESLVSHSLNIPADIQVFEIATRGYSGKPWETSYWEQFLDTQIYEGFSRRYLMKTEDGCNIVRKYLLRFVNSAWY